MIRMDEDCRKLHRIWDEEASGWRRSPEEEFFIADHLASCPECKTEFLFTESVRWDGPDHAQTGLDDLSKRRWLSEVYDRLDEPDATASRSAAGESTAPRPSWRRLAAVAAAVVAVAALGTVVHRYVVQTDRRSGIAPSDVHGVDTETDGWMLMNSGDVRIQGIDASIEHPVSSGDVIETISGEAAFRLASACELYLLPGTAIEIQQVDSDGTVIEFERGHLFVEVEATTSGPTFVVETRAGRVVVTGTRFSVNDEGGVLEVQVYRGSVRVEDDGLTPREVHAGTTAILGTPGTRPGTEPESQLASKTYRTLQLLDGDHSSVVVIRTVPSGATVVLDDAVLGLTPVTASIRQDYRVFEIQLDGYTPVRDVLRVDEGKTVARTYEMAPVSRGATPSALSAPAEPELKIPERSPQIDSGEPLVARADLPGATPVDQHSIPAIEEEATSPSGPEILELGNRLRTERRWEEAAAEYSRLISDHPDSPDAAVALISLGILQLDHLGLPAAALVSFESYLAQSPDGILAQEASFGCAMALLALDRQEEASAAFEAFVEEYPDAVQAPAALELLREDDGKRR